MTTTQMPSSEPSSDADEQTDHGLASVVTLAAHQFESVSGRRPESIIGAQGQADGGGWSITLETVEMDGIPDSTSMLAMYRVELDRECRLVSFERLRRYIRSAGDPPS